jgi:flagellin-like protein
MKRLFKSKKALSPVVAAIILIAVTVAVSIAVAAWMGALTFTFMKTEELKVTSMTFNGSSSVATNNITLAIKNPGTSKVTISSASLNDVAVSGANLVGPAPIDVQPGATVSVTIDNVNWVTGNKYKITLLSATGTNVAAYEATA